MSSFHFRVAEIATPKLLTLIHTRRSLPLITTGEKFGQVKPSAYTVTNLTLKKICLPPSTITCFSSKICMAMLAIVFLLLFFFVVVIVLFCFFFADN